jgi:hypothetical protein
MENGAGDPAPSSFGVCEGESYPPQVEHEPPPQPAHPPPPELATTRPSLTAANTEIVLDV